MNSEGSAAWAEFPKFTSPPRRSAEGDVYVLAESSIPDIRPTWGEFRLITKLSYVLGRLEQTGSAERRPSPLDRIL